MDCLFSSFWLVMSAVFSTKSIIFYTLTNTSTKVYCGSMSPPGTISSAIVLEFNYYTRFTGRLVRLLQPPTVISQHQLHPMWSTTFYVCIFKVFFSVSTSAESTRFQPICSKDKINCWTSSKNFKNIMNR